MSLLFVYNADSGVFNTMADIGHKIFSPSTYRCDLCAITHGYFSEREEWREFIEELAMEVNFLHRDEFTKQHPGADADLPAIFVVREGELYACADAALIGECEDLADLKDLVTRRCLNNVIDRNL